MPKKRVLFKEPVGGWRNPGRMLMNWSGDPIRDLEMMARSYQQVAHDRVEKLRSQRGGMRPADSFEAYPIVFLYRQAFELVLKAIVFAGSVALKDMGEEPMPIKDVMRHPLTPLFNEVSRVFEALGSNDDDAWDFKQPELSTRADFEALVREFDRIDAGSYTFRYSVKTDGSTPSLDKGFEFDLFSFADVMDRIIPALEGAPEWIREEMQGRWEAAYEAQQEAWANGDYDYDPPEYDPGDYEPGDYEPYYE